MRWPTAQDVLAAHEMVLQATGGASGVRDRGALESALHRPLATFDGVALYPGLPQKVAALFESLICNHPFVDGNKRTAVVVTFTALRTNGLTLTVSQDDAVETAIAVATGRLDLATLAAWFSAHSAGKV